MPQATINAICTRNIFIETWLLKIVQFLLIKSKRAMLSKETNQQRLHPYVAYRAHSTASVVGLSCLVAEFTLAPPARSPRPLALKRLSLETTPQSNQGWTCNASLGWTVWFTAYRCVWRQRAKVCATSPCVTSAPPCCSFVAGASTPHMGVGPAVFFGEHLCNFALNVWNLKKRPFLQTKRGRLGACRRNS